jgi:Holliday junction resolvasome RuvABC endonuclease subunit
MRSIGFRAEPDAINWAIVEGDKDAPELVDHGKIIAPKSFKDEATRLSHLRGQVMDRIAALKPDCVAVRYPESFRKSNCDARIRVEGVILEACAASNVPVSSGAMRSISSRMGSKAAKAYLKADDVRGLEFPKKNPNCREAILVAVSALEG